MFAGKEITEAAFANGILDKSDLLVCNLGKLFRFFDGFSQSAGLIHQSQFRTLVACPDAALCDLIDLLLCLLTSFSCFPGKGIVSECHVLADNIPFLFAKRNIIAE